MSQRGMEATLPSHLTKSLSNGISRVSGIALLLLIWEASRAIAQMNFLIPYPSEILLAARSMVFGEGTEEFVASVIATARSAIEGFLIAATLGVVFGVSIGRYTALRIGLYPYVNAIYAIPRVALLPVVIVWFGLGKATAVALVVLAAGFTVMIGVTEGVLRSSHTYDHVGKSFGASEWQTLRKIVLPGAGAYIYVALRLGAARSVTAVLIAELYLDQGAGLGRLLRRASSALNFDRAFVVVFAIALLGLAMMGFFDIIAKALARRHLLQLPRAS